MFYYAAQYLKHMNRMFFVVYSKEINFFMDLNNYELCVLLILIIPLIKCILVSPDDALILACYQFFLLGDVSNK